MGVKPGKNPVKTRGSRVLFAPPYSVGGIKPGKRDFTPYGTGRAQRETREMTVQPANPHHHGKGVSQDMDEQLYRWVRDHEVVNRFGRTVRIVEWETECPDCGRTFKISTMPAFTNVRRRCEDCKAAGVRVGRPAVRVWPDGCGGDKGRAARGD